MSRFLVRCLCAVLLIAMPGWAAKRRRAPAKPRLTTEQRWFASLSLQQKAAQLLVIPFYGENPPAKSVLYRRFARQVGSLGVGGLILVNAVRDGRVQNADPVRSATFLNRMQKLARTPLIVGGDFERGASMRLSGAVKFPHNMAFAAARDVEGTRQLGAITARESRAIGVHWVYAPVADVNNNPDNPIINIRSYSENPGEVSEHVRAFIEGARSDPAHPVLVTVKHFPGHGDTAIDTHYGLGKVAASIERLNQVELAPFRTAIAAKVDSVMTAHLWVPAIESREIPATVSQQVLTGLLRQKLGFEGIITTDAMDMEGLSKQIPPGEAAVRAIEAGVDVLLMPPDPAEAVRAIAAAVKSGRIRRERLDESVRKMLAAKVQVGLDKSRYVDLKAIPKALDRAADAAVAQRVAERAVTLVRNEPAAVPLERPADACWYILTEVRNSKQGLRTAEVLTEKSPQSRRAVLDPSTTTAELDEATGSMASCTTHVVAAFAGYRGNSGLPAIYNVLFQKLEGTGKPLVLIGLGSPYLLRAVPKATSFLATFSTVPPSEEAAVKGVLGEIPVTGKLPVSIPGLARYGEGLALASKVPVAALKPRSQQPGPVAATQASSPGPLPRTQMPNPIAYFEIPVTDMDRAMAFYTAVFGYDFQLREIDGNQMALFPWTPGEAGASGALAKGEVYVPSKNGPIVYFHTSDVAATLARATTHGARILHPVTEVGDGAAVAEFEDSEGNRVALLSRSGH